MQTPNNNNNDDDGASMTTWESRQSFDQEDDDGPFPTIEDNQLYELEAVILSEMDEYLKSNLLKYSSPTFHEDLVDEIQETIYEAATQSGMCGNTEANRQEIGELVSETAETYFNRAHIYPVRSYPPEMEVSDLIHPTPIATLQQKIQALKSLPQPPQRTPEWYQFRHDLLTASNLYKALGSPAQFNQLVCEKCKPITVSDPLAVVNTASPTHWGNKYEEVTTMIYEAMHPGNKVDTEFGCIRHAEYAFIGASPDGIVVQGPRVGHMLEIKNTVSREMEDTPILSHWVQCQVQMETCDLDFCDYVQTNIKEVERDAFYEIETDEFSDVKYKGVILHLISRTLGAAKYKYVYMPLFTSTTCTMTHVVRQLQVEQVEQWTRAQIVEYGSEYHLFETLYWYLNEYSCVIVPRNQEWFQSAFPSFVRVWETVVNERIHGYEHRLPKKRETRRSTTAPQALLVSFHTSDREQQGQYDQEQEQEQEQKKSGGDDEEDDSIRRVFLRSSYK
jgi:putative phage-type endonuclease